MVIPASTLLFQFRSSSPITNSQNHIVYIRTLYIRIVYSYTVHEKFKQILFCFIPAAAAKKFCVYSRKEKMELHLLKTNEIKKCEIYYIHRQKQTNNGAITYLQLATILYSKYIVGPSRTFTWKKRISSTLFLTYKIYNTAVLPLGDAMRNAREKEIK